MLVIFILVVIWVGRKVANFSKKSKKGLIIGGKLFVSTVQILMAVPTVFDVVLPTNFVNFLALFNIFNFSFVELFDIGCSIRVTAYHVMLSGTLVPLVCCVPILFIWIYHYVKEEAHASRITRKTLKMNSVSLLLSMTYFFLPGTSMSLFAVFPCDTLDDETRWVKSDYSLDCSESNENRRLNLVYAGIMLVVYPIGIPLVYAIVLFKNRSKLNPKRNNNLVLDRRGVGYEDYEAKVIAQREEDQGIQHTIFLWGSYRPCAWWYEIFECLRRLALTGALVFIRQGSITQMAIGVLICICSGFVFALVWPYATFRDNALGMMSHCQLTGTLFSALLFMAGKDASLAYDKEGTGSVVVNNVDVYNNASNFRSSSASFDVQNNPMRAGGGDKPAPGGGLGKFFRRNESSSVSTSARGLKLVKASTSVLSSRSVASSEKRGSDPPPPGRGSIGRSTSLTDGWSKEWSDEHQDSYYWNTETGEVSWERPASV
ncbi:hypothetical protein TrRE_jg10032 [Triparma retinervis]|uniref:WW domain-containing protein n=1 Tax=Triparma retinervis TaxID=2557542 RepID=A0A9W7DWN3_9STRA|nr:hypothetical protein TrRE_jg10032 [Triparma retinervis]